MFSRLYLEITTCCNRACSFCPGTARPAAFVTPETFRTLAAKLRPYGQYLYLHVMGEPLLHPQLPELLEICRALDFRVTLTTNGTLLPARQPVLLAAPALRKVSVSLHSFEANEAGDFRAYLTGCTDFARAAMAAGVLTDFRLWNLDGAQTKGLHDRNDEILAHLHAAFSEPWQRNTWGWRLAKGVFVSFGERFDWPDAAGGRPGRLGPLPGAFRSAGGPVRRHGRALLPGPRGDARAGKPPPPGPAGDPIRPSGPHDPRRLRERHPRRPPLPPLRLRRTLQLTPSLPSQGRLPCVKGAVTEGD